LETLWLDGDPAPLRITEAEPPKIAAHVYCGQTARWIKIIFGMEVGLRRVDFMLHGSAALTPKGAEPPIFGPRLLWPNGCMHQDATWYVGRPRPTRHYLRDFDVDQLLPEKMAHRPPRQFLAYVYCCQTAGWMKTSLGTETTSAQATLYYTGFELPQKWHSRPTLFGSCLLWPRLPISATADLLLLYFVSLVLVTLCHK